MTYEEVLAALQAQQPYMQGGGSWQDGMWQPTQTALPGVYSMGGGGWVRDPGQGFIEGYAPEADGVRLTQYGSDGSTVGSHFLNSTDNWQDTLRGMVGTLGGAALLGNAGSLLGAVGSGGTGATTGAGMAAGYDPAMAARLGSGDVPTSLLGAAGTAGTAGALGTAGSALGGVGSALSGAGSLLGNGGLLAAGLGAAAGIAGNGDLTTSQNTSSTGSASSSLAPWLQPYAQQMVGNAANLANGPMSNATLDQARQMLMSGNPTVAAGAQQQQDVIAGKYLNSNPYIDQVASNIGQRMGDAYAVGTRAGMLGTGAANGGYNAGAQQALGYADRNFADSLGATMSNLYYGNYNTERNAQNAAAQGSTAFGNYGLNAATTLGNFGQADWLRPFTANQYLGSAINPAYGSQTNSTQNGTQSSTMNAPNNWMAGAGGALAGYSLYNQIFK